MTELLRRNDPVGLLSSVEAEIEGFCEMCVLAVVSESYYVQQSLNLGGRSM